MRAAAFAYHNMGIAGLNALERAGFRIVSIFSHEDDPSENCWFGSVSEWAMERRIPLEYPANLKDTEWGKRIASLRPEIIFSFYYRHMIPEDILKIPPRGAYNLHGSLLPAYRGRCPVNWVLVHGEKQTGVTLHHMVRKADAGDIVGQRRVEIAPDDTALTLYKKLCDTAGTLLDELLPLMKDGRAPRIPQDLSQGGYFGGRRPEDGRIDWRWTAERIYNLIRAVTDPYPGAFCHMADGSKLLIWWAIPKEERALDKTRPPGLIEIDGKQILVWTGKGQIRLLNVQIGNEKISGEGMFLYFKDKEGMLLT